VPLDNQQVECLARQALTAALTADGLEVARPERDCGIDLLAYTVNPPRMMPIQMRAETAAGYSVEKKHAGIDSLIMVYVWNACSLGGEQFFAMRWSEAAEIADRLSYAWDSRGRWISTRPPARLIAAIESHRVSPGGWSALLESL
jgi:hypothetical protein